MGLMFAIFHEFGKIPCCNDLLNSLVIGSTIRIADIFNNLVGISSGPVDLLGSREFRIDKTSRSEIVILFRIGTFWFCVVLGNCAPVGMSSRAWDAKKSLRICALHSAFDTVSPSGFKRGRWDEYTSYRSGYLEFDDICESSVYFLLIC